MGTLDLCQKIPDKMQKVSGQYIQLVWRKCPRWHILDVFSGLNDQIDLNPTNHPTMFFMCSFICVQYPTTMLFKYKIVIAVYSTVSYYVLYVYIVISVYGVSACFLPSQLSLVPSSVGSLQLLSADNSLPETVRETTTHRQQHNIVYCLQPCDFITFITASCPCVCSKQHSHVYYILFVLYRRP